jgi:hypothetical protein
MTFMGRRWDEWECWWPYGLKWPREAANRRKRGKKIFLYGVWQISSKEWKGPRSKRVWRSLKSKQMNNYMWKALKMAGVKRPRWEK